MAMMTSDFFGGFILGCWFALAVIAIVRMAVEWDHRRSTGCRCLEWDESRTVRLPEQED